MPDVLSATELRSNIYRILDEILETGQPKEVVRRGQTVVLMPKTARGLRLSELPRRQVLTCTPEQLVQTSWQYAPDDEP